MIFLSYNHQDQVLVEQIAVRLKDVFGIDKVFYDSWSMQPGDGIIDKMNQGLANCKIFLFFISNNSLQSNMVKLEWQNALMKATKGSIKFIPVRIDDCFMPPVLMQNLYIDLYGQGIEVALRQIIDTILGRNTFVPRLGKFSNLVAYRKNINETIRVECRAEHFLEPVSSFIFLVKNNEDELKFNCLSSSLTYGGFQKDIVLGTGQKYNGEVISIEKATAPGFPFVVEIIPKSGSTIDFIGVMHEKKRGYFEMIPLINE
jgi:hypothetical protein